MTCPLLLPWLYLLPLLSATSTGLRLTHPGPEDKVPGMFPYLMRRQGRRTIGLFSGGPHLTCLQCGEAIASRVCWILRLIVGKRRY